VHRLCHGLVSGPCVRSSLCLGLVSGPCVRALCLGLVSGAPCVWALRQELLVSGHCVWAFCQGLVSGAGPEASQDGTPARTPPPRQAGRSSASARTSPFRASDDDDDHDREDERATGSEDWHPTTRQAQQPGRRQLAGYGFRCWAPNNSPGTKATTTTTTASGLRIKEMVTQRLARHKSHDDARLRRQ